MLRHKSEMKEGKEKPEIYSTWLNPLNAVEFLSASLEENIENLNKIFIDDDTITTRWIANSHNEDLRYCLVQNDGMVNAAITNENIIKPLMLSKAPLAKGSQMETLLHQVVFINQVKKTNQWQQIIESVTYGDTVLFIDGEAEALLLNSKGFNTRGIDEPSGEKILSGPREGFCEALMINLSMIRRRLRTNELKIKFQSFGVRTHTQACICYIDGIVNKKVLAELYRRLETIDMDGVLDTNYITECIRDSRFSPFRTTGYTERPDVVVGKLLEGRIALLVDGSPVVLTLPYLFIENFQSSEDYYLSFYYTSFERILRIIGFFMSITIPALFIVIGAFHHEILPTTLLTNIARERLGVPLPAGLEAFVMLILFDILKETGIRMPSGIGQALSIVGALVVGQAAVEAKLVAAPMVIVVAITAITGLLVPKMNASIFFVRLIFLFLATSLGLLGLILGIAGLFIHVFSLHSFGVPQIMPVDRLQYQEVKDTFIRGPWWKMIRRPENLTENRYRMKRGDQE
ncbi:spore germination protein [Anaerosinus massiliensis]|uniref:spore germination protein n=1 Tax=Massilibacillus massiliensis TaxID=1806837 RepID=UPI000ABD1743|nr:spore germination protein [Massilibacillus massiliensis]